MPAAHTCKDTGRIGTIRNKARSVTPHALCDKSCVELELDCGCNIRELALRNSFQIGCIMQLNYIQG